MNHESMTDYVCQEDIVIPRNEKRSGKFVPQKYNTYFANLARSREQRKRDDVPRHTRADPRSKSAPR